MDLTLYNRLIQYIDVLVTGQVANSLSDDTITEIFSKYFNSQLYIVDTIEEMLNIDTNNESITLVFVKDKDRGGIFKFNKDTHYINNFGTIFYGYERLLNNTKLINVKWFGAKGDGYTDDTIAIKRAINAGGKHTTIFFPKGDYYITDEINPFTNTTWQGEGSLDYADLYYDVDNITCDHDKYYWVHFNTDENLNKFIKGDQIFLSGFANKLTNKPHEISQIDNENKKILIIHSYYTGSDYDENDINGTARIPFVVGGSAIRHRSFDGTLTIGKWFIHTEGLDYFNIKDMGFVGAGVNQSSGSEIKIIRNENRAMEGFQWDNVSWMDIPGNAITIEAPINSSFTNIRIKKCAFDAIRLVSINGSAMTSTTFKNVYITSARRGFYIETAVYNVFEAIVVEGASIAFHGKVMNSNTFNSISTETVKYRTFRGGQGISFLFENGYGNVFNSPSVIYNSESYKWVKGSFMFLGSSYGDLPTAIINGGRSHNSLNLAHNVLCYEQTSDTNERIYYIDTPLDVLKNEYTKSGKFIAIHKKDYSKQDPTQINRYRILDIWDGCIDCIQTDNNSSDHGSNPTKDDDADAGYNVGDIWNNTDTEHSFLCVDNTNDNAIWKDIDKISAIKVYVDHKESTNMTTFTDHLISKIGRTVGNDLYTIMNNRIYQYEYNSTDKKLYIWLDVYDRIPNLYLHKLHLDTDNKAFNSEMLCSMHSIQTINNTDYLQVTFKASKQIKESTDFNWHNSDVQQNDGTVYISTNYEYITNTAENIIVTKYQWDYDTKLLNVLFTPTRFIKAGEQITLSNNLNTLINGTYTITDVIGWEQLNNFSNNPISIKIEIDVDLNIDYDLTTSETIGVYSRDNYLQAAPSQIILTGSPMYRVIDKFNIVHRNNIISNNFILKENEDSLTIPMFTPYDFNWNIQCASNNIDLAYTNNSIILSRNDDSTNEIIGIYIGYPKTNKMFVGIDKGE